MKHPGDYMKKRKGRKNKKLSKKEILRREEQRSGSQEQEVKFVDDGEGGVLAIQGTKTRNRYSVEKVEEKQ